MKRNLMFEGFLLGAGITALIMSLIFMPMVERNRDFGMDMSDLYMAALDDISTLTKVCGGVCESVSDIASEYGITVTLVERVVKTYLLNSIGTIESTSSIFNSSFEPKVDVIKFDSDFVEYLKEQAGYQKTINIDETSLRGMSSTYSSNGN
ncbi:hypothetical protein M3914_003309 [Vibrio metschnikovii]|nr:hypothetical protein [Vibrio metschnikovii]